MPPLFAAPFLQLVIELVTATDMAINNKIVNSMAEKVRAARAVFAEAVAEAGGAEAGSAEVEAAKAFKPRSRADAVLGLQLALKAADIGHLALPWPQHEQWVRLLEEEFFQQGDREKALGHPTSFLCDRDAPGATETQVSAVRAPSARVVLAVFCRLYLAHCTGSGLSWCVAWRGTEWFFRLCGHAALRRPRERFSGHETHDRPSQSQWRRMVQA